MDCSPPGSSVHGILQARKLEWVAISFFKGSSQPRGQTCVSCMGRQILYHEPLGKPVLHLVGARNLMMDTMVNFRMKMQWPGLPSIQWTKSSLPSCCSVIQSYRTLCNPMDYSPPGSSVQGTLQARILEWVAIPFSRGSF